MYKELNALIGILKVNMIVFLGVVLLAFLKCYKFATIEASLFYAPRGSQLYSGKLLVDKSDTESTSVL